MINFEFIRSGGDWPVFYPQMINELPWFPQVWYPSNGNGFGQNVAFVLGYKTFFAILVKFFSEILHLPWNAVELIIFFIPFWVLSFLSSYFLSKYFFKNKIFNFMSSIIFATNTYSLMLVGGGQMGVAIAYAFSPFVLLSFLKLLDLPNVRRSLLSSLLLGLLVCIDPRVAGIILIISFIFLLFSLSTKRIFYFLLSIIFAVVLNSFWIIPFLFSGTSGLAQEYTNADILYFLSFAKLENALGLMHPNWPENFFGKVGFMRSEFLILPIFAFSAFLFKTSKKIKILGLIAILGIFLSKGVNEPFGSVYYFLSNHVPLFTMFRDATKWYILVIISYSLLIPQALDNFNDLLFKVKKFSIFNLQFTNKLKNFQFAKQIIVIAFLIFWVITIRQFFLGQLTGTFQRKEIPEEYIRLQNLISSQNKFFRILWVPQQSRFGYFSNTNPPISSYDLITSHDVIPTFEFLNKKSTEEFIKDSAVKYVIVPSDPLREIYLTDRKYDPKVYDAFQENIKKISWLKQNKSFKQISVYEVKDPKPHAYLLESGGGINLKKVSLTEYKGEVKRPNAISKIVFSEQFDSHWLMSNDSQDTYSIKYKKMFNSFEILPGKGIVSFTIKYTTEKWVYFGLIISIITFVVSSAFILKKK